MIVPGKTRGRRRAGFAAKPGRDVEVGAYARRQRRNRILRAVFGVGLVVAAVFLYRSLRLGGGDVPVGGYRVRVECVSCGHTARLDVPFEQTFPLICPKCRAKTLRQLWKCRRCDSEFVPRQSAGPVRCPRCKSDQVGSAAVP